MRDVWRLEKQLAEQKQENLRLKQRNEKLAAEVEDLKSGKEAIEERARSELGLIKPGEVFYQVVDPPSSEKKAPNAEHCRKFLVQRAAGGRSARFGGEIPKQYLPIGGKP